MRGENIHLLVVDDNRLERLKLSRALQSQGYTVSAAEGGARALEMLRAQPFDLVFLDIEMPRVDGYEVLKAMKDDDCLSKVPVIVVSGIDDSENVRRCRELGAVETLPKSLDAETLKQRVAAQLQKSNPPS